MKNNLFKYTLPSALILLTGIIGLIKYFFYPHALPLKDLLIAAFNLSFFIAIGLLLNKYKWTKYTVLLLAIFGLINFPSLSLTLSTPRSIISLTFITQRILLVAATILLFKPNKTNKITNNKEA